MTEFSCRVFTQVYIIINVDVLTPIPPPQSIGVF